jgi:hypothetical protein
VAVLQEGKELKVLATNDLGNSVYTTPVASHGVLYITNRNRLFAIQGMSDWHGARRISPQT